MGSLVRDIHIPGRYVEGCPATLLPLVTGQELADINMCRLGTSVAAFLRVLQSCDTAGAPPAGQHSWFRGALLTHYDQETRRCLDALANDGDSDTDNIDISSAREVWEHALAVGEWSKPPVWYRGDVAPGNLLADQHGRLTGVLDFGCCGVGDPACDLVIAWTLLSDADGSREAFRRAVDLDAATWARALGWALWKALLQLEEKLTAQEGQSVVQCRAAGEVVREVIADHSHCHFEEEG